MKQPKSKDTPIDTKYCPRCGETKPTSEFGVNRSQRDGLQGYCRPCGRAAAKAGKKRVHTPDCGCKGCVARFNATNSGEIMWCPKCETGKPLGDFHLGSGASGRSTYCIACLPPPKIAVRRRAHWKKRYRITEHKVFAMLEAQHRMCICGDVLTEENLTIDHDHSCCPGAESCGDCVRGVLCGLCNRALGMINDDPNKAMALAAYLLQFEDVLSNTNKRGY